MIYQQKHRDADYLHFNWNEGDKGDTKIALLRKNVVTNRRAHTCQGNGPGELHRCEVGERMLVQSALVDGEWGGYRLCLQCCDAWMEAAR